MGEWFVGFFRDQGWNVDVSDPEADDSVPIEYANDYDVVMVAVPIEVTVDVIEDVAERMTDGLLMDVTSVKTEPVEAMVNGTEESIEVLGTHPMYGPSVPDMRGQTVILVESRTGEKTEEVKELFSSAGANVQYSTPEEHDEMMSVVQGLTHTAYISLGSTLEKLDFDVDDSRRFMSPVYEIMLDFVGRVLNQNPYLYAEIQVNQPVGKIHESLEESVEELEEYVENDDVEGFVDVMQSAAKHYGDTKSALRRSDKLIQANVREYEELLESVGSERGLEHIYSGVVHVGEVKGLDGRVVRLQEGGREIELNVENVELLTAEELRDWKKNNLDRKNRDVSVIYWSIMDTGILEDITELSHEDVVNVETVDEYRGDAIPDDAVSYTLRLEILEDGSAKDAVEDAVRVLEGIGGELRS